MTSSQCGQVNEAYS